MAMLSSKHSHCFCFITLLLHFGLLFLICAQPAHSSAGSTVEFLPGFHGPLPFHLQTGYVGLGESAEEVQVFCYFVKSENNPQDDPLLLWLSGGPGCTSFAGLAFEIGFTYAKTEAANQSSDWGLAHHAHQFLRKWLINNPEYLSHKVYVGGDSYSGIPIPALFQEILYGNENGVQPRINIQGYILGNPLTTRHEINYEIPFAHGMGLISDELYESLQKYCEGEYGNIDTNNLSCLRDYQLFRELIEEVDVSMILEPGFCGYKMFVIPPRNSLMKRSLVQKVKGISIPSKCRRLGYLQAHYWGNDDDVQKALHVRKGTTYYWRHCNYDLNYKQDIDNSFYIHVNLSTKGYRSLIYSGDHDMTISFLSTQAWIRSLNYSIIDDWRPWHVNGQVAGYTRTYSNGMTYATVKGAGHTAPEFTPEECFAMFKRWISNEHL
ncbi:serine carboxypeptidase-like 7 isoform X2 [Prosopis cineraria]|uniref:serine carboxypeptidase-like 7 isoform X2 n=1 Tax=Prosopis cineraria TaxID=364024 RepID=UPI00240FC1F7|nr:serine carboxypeptidase-like 7 isoform X2 [Prosopis cineraria]